jgi:hypothetical protein
LENKQDKKMLNYLYYRWIPNKRNGVLCK